MSMGLPVVSSPQAAQGLGPAPKDLLAVADGAEATVAAIARWFADPNEARRVGLAAAAWIREHWHWDRVFADYRTLLRRLGVDA
jgi:glycosyltransferase involved in cell wall biosynthesis